MKKNKLMKFLILLITVICFGLLAFLVVFLGKKILDDKNTPEYAKKLFDNTYVHEINVEISDEDWEDLKTNPLEKTKYKVNVTIDGEEIDEVSFATKGNTSLTSVASSDSDRYSFKINFGKYIDDQTYYGLDKLNLNNIMSDSTYMKDYLAYEIMREAGVKSPLTSYVSLSINGEVFGLYLAIEEVGESLIERYNCEEDSDLYKPETEMLANMGNMGDMKDMKMPDGFEMPEGFDPANFDPSNMDFSKMQMPSFNNDETNGENDKENKEDKKGGFGDFGGSSKGADLKYTDDNVDSYTDIFDNEETDVTDEDRSLVITALKALSKKDNAEEYWDVDAVISYFVAHNFVLNFDSYTGSMLHNYYLLEEGNSKFSILPWDYNLAFGAFMQGKGKGDFKMPSMNNKDSEEKTDETNETEKTEEIKEEEKVEIDNSTSIINYPIDTPLESDNEENRPLWALISSNESYMKLYHDKFNKLIKKYFESGKCEKEITRVYNMIKDYVESDPTAFYTLEEFEKGIETLKEFCNLRMQSIRGQLNGTIPSSSDEQEEDSSSLIDASSITISDMGTQNMGGDHGGEHGGKQGDVENMTPPNMPNGQMPQDPNTQNK